MRIATWNVNSIRARWPRLEAWLAANEPDVLCLQETKVTDEELPALELRATGYKVLHRGQKTYNGVAILARSDISDPVYALGDDAVDEQARMVAGTIDGVRVVSVYVPNGQSVGSEAYAYKLRWLAALRAFLQRDGLDRPLAVCGDYNIAPEDRDVYDPRAYDLMTTGDERDALARVVDLGLRDVLRLHHPDEQLFTWWDYRFGAFKRGRGARIDHIFVTEPLAARCHDARVDRDERASKQPSDHAPVLADFGDAR